MLKGIKAVAAQMLLAVLGIAGGFTPYAARADFAVSYQGTNFTFISGQPGVTTSNFVSATIILQGTAPTGDQQINYCSNASSIEALGFTCSPGAVVLSAVISDGVHSFSILNSIVYLIVFQGAATRAPVPLFWIEGTTNVGNDYSNATVVAAQNILVPDSGPAINETLIYGPDGIGDVVGSAGSADGVWTCTSGCSPPSPPVIASSLPNGAAGVAYPSTVLVSGGTPPYSISATGLPPGLSVGTNGMVSGTPDATDSGTYKVTVSVTDSAGQMAGPQTVPITIAPESTCNASSNAKRRGEASGSAAGQCTPLTITTTELPPAQAYSLSTPRASTYFAVLTASGGEGIYSFSVQGLPAGLKVDADGFITGTVTSNVPDTYDLTITVTDSAGYRATTKTPLELQTICGDPEVNPSGDDRDAIINEYLPGISPYPGGILFRPYSVAPLNVVEPSAINAPHCDDFASNTDVNFTYYFPSYASINNHSSKTGEPDYPFAFTIIDNVLLNEYEGKPTQIGPVSLGLDAWVNAIRNLGDSSKRTISSAYRDPIHQYVVSTSKTHTPGSQHMRGDAIDMQLNHTSNRKAWQTEWDNVLHAAKIAGADWEEQFDGDGPCLVGQLGCVHADWRKHNPHTYLNP